MLFAWLYYTLPGKPMPETKSIACLEERAFIHILMSSCSNPFCILFCMQVVDYESRSSYSFSVEVMNPTVDPRFLRRGPFKDRASIRVAVLDADEPPRFSRARYHMEVSENCPPACTVGRVSAVDPDTGLSSNIR